MTWQPTPLNVATTLLWASCKHTYSGTMVRRYDTELPVCDRCGVPRSPLPWVYRAPWKKEGA